jgi:hypothetical protein
MMVGSKENALRAWRPLAAGAALVMALAACGSDDTSPKVRSEGNAATSAEDFSPQNFDASSIDVDNRYFPLEPGTQYTFKGSATNDGEKEPHSIVITVTDLVKEIDGIEAVVVWERDFVDQDLEESELAFFAQDTTSTVWHLGEYTEVYENGKDLVGGQAWLVGHLQGAKAGIFMPANPDAGTAGYSEGFAPAPYYWADKAQIYKVGEETTVPAGHYSDVLVIKEFSDREPDAGQLKYYAPGVGGVRIGWTGKDPSREELALVELAHLDPAALDAARRGALALEERANVYGSTPAAEARPAG